MPTALPTTTYTGTIRNLAGDLVTFGQVIFTLVPSIDTTLSGTSRFVPTALTFPIGADGSVNAVVTQNTALSPSGTYYRIEVQAGFRSPGSIFYDTANASARDLSMVSPTPPEGPINYGAATLLTPFSEVPGGVIDGANATFTLQETPTLLGLFLNGVFQSPGVDYHLLGSTIVYVAPPQVGDAQHAQGFYGNASGGSGGGAGGGGGGTGAVPLIDTDDGSVWQLTVFQGQLRLSR